MEGELFNEEMSSSEDLLESFPLTPYEVGKKKVVD